MEYYLSDILKENYFYVEVFDLMIKLLCKKCLCIYICNKNVIKFIYYVYIGLFFV